jgi:hypothetical protein
LLQPDIFMCDINPLNDSEMSRFIMLIGDFNKYRDSLSKPRLRLVEAGSLPMTKSPKKHNHYFKDVRHIDYVDVYMVCALFGVTDAAIAHAIKKQLVAGGRGAGKDFEKDIQEAIDSLNRCLAIRQEQNKEDGVFNKASASELTHTNTKVYPHVVDESISVKAAIDDQLKKMADDYDKTMVSAYGQEFSISKNATQKATSLDVAQNMLVGLLSSYHANHLKSPTTNETKEAIAYLQLNRPDLAKVIGC